MFYIGHTLISGAEFITCPFTSNLTFKIRVEDDYFESIA